MAILMRAWLGRAILALVAAGWCAAAGAQSTDGSVLERRIKAALLSQFAEFVTWPEAALGDTAAPFQIAIAGPALMVEELSQLTAGRSASGRPIRVRRMREEDALSGIQIVYIAGVLTERTAELLRASPAQPVLVVTDAEGALAQGSVINFVLVEGKVRFELSPAAAQRRGLQLSPRLVGVALRRP